MFPLEFHAEVKHQETRVMGLLCGKGCDNNNNNKKKMHLKLKTHSNVWGNAKFNKGLPFRNLHASFGELPTETELVHQIWSH